MGNDTGAAAGEANIAELRAAEAEALARAGEAQRCLVRAQSGAETDREAIELLRRRIAAEEFAARQALARAAAEQDAEAAAAERAHAERMLEIATRARVDAEEKALQDAKRREFAASELARAARERVERERQAEGLARDAASVDRHAAELALVRHREDSALEAVLMARSVAEADARQQGERRKAAEADAAAMADRVAQLGGVPLGIAGSQSSGSAALAPCIAVPTRLSLSEARSPRIQPALVLVVAVATALLAVWLFWPRGDSAAARPGQFRLERSLSNALSR